MTEDYSDSQPSLPIEVPLSKGKFIVIVSPEDADYVKQFVWSAVPSGARTYAVRSEKGNNKRKIQLAREIMERMIQRALTASEYVRHKRPNSSLDCTRDNLVLKTKK